MVVSWRVVATLKNFLTSVQKKWPTLYAGMILVTNLVTSWLVALITCSVHSRVMGRTWTSPFTIHLLISSGYINNMKMSPVCYLRYPAAVKAMSKSLGANCMAFVNILAASSTRFWSDRNWPERKITKRHTMIFQGVHLKLHYKFSTISAMDKENCFKVG